MGYRVYYSPEDNKKYPKTNKHGNDRYLGYFAVVIAAVITLTVPRLRSNLRKWLIPGDEAVTREVFSQMVEDVRDGESVGEAVITFCQEILDNGKETTAAH